MNWVFYRQQLVDHIHMEREQGPLWFLWFILLPIVPLVAYMSLGYLRILPEAEGIPRHLYIVVGVTSWLLFTDAVAQPFRSIQKNRPNFIRQEIGLTHLLTAWLPARLIGGFLQFLFCIVAVFFFFPIQLESLAIYFLLVFAGVSIFLPLGALFAIIGLISPSVTNLVEITNRFLLFLSAVVFPLPSGPYLDVIKTANPYFVFVDNARAALFGLPIQWAPIGCWVGFGCLLILFLRKRLAVIAPDVRDYLF